MVRVSIVCRSKDRTGTNNGYILTFPESLEEVDEKLFGEESPIIITFKYDNGIVRIHKEDILNVNLEEVEDHKEETKESLPELPEEDEEKLTLKDVN